MKSIILLFSFFISLSFFACVDDSSSIGAKWVQSSFLNEQMDTCTVLLSTVLSDSIATSGDTVCQIGYRDDNLWGKITASFYAEYEVPSYSFDENIQYEFDSITIRLYSSGNYLGDTLKTQRIHLHELTKNIELDDRGYLYNTTTAYYNETPLASFDFRPTPGSPSEELEIRLPDAWGEEWFNLMLNDGRWVQSQDFFHDYFKGIAFIPDANDACISGFQVNDSSMCITVYYHQITETLNEKTLVFNTSNTLTYNKIEQDRSNIPIANLQSGDGNEYSSGKSEHQVYLQGMTGMYVTIDFPHLNNLCEKGELVTIESATLQLYPVKGTYDGMYPLPKSLALYTANNENVTQSVITDLTGSSVQSGNLVVDEMSYDCLLYTSDAADEL